MILLIISLLNVLFYFLNKFCSLHNILFFPYISHSTNLLIIEYIIILSIQKVFIINTEQFVYCLVLVLYVYYPICITVKMY